MGKIHHTLLRQHRICKKGFDMTCMRSSLGVPVIGLGWHQQHAVLSGWDSALRALSSIPGQKVRSHEP